MTRRQTNRWLGIGFDAWSLGFEASAVIGLRALKIAQGGVAGQAEAEPYGTGRGIGGDASAGKIL